MKLLALLGTGALAAGAMVVAAPASAQHHGHAYGHHGGHGGHGYGGGYRHGYYGGGQRWGGHYRHCRVYRGYHHPVRRCY